MGVEKHISPLTLPCVRLCCIKVHFHSGGGSSSCQPAEGSHWLDMLWIFLAQTSLLLPLIKICFKPPQILVDYRKGYNLLLTFKKYLKHSKVDDKWEGRHQCRIWPTWSDYMGSIVRSQCYQGTTGHRAPLSTGPSGLEPIAGPPHLWSINLFQTVYKQRQEMDLLRADEIYKQSQSIFSITLGRLWWCWTIQKWPVDL